MQTLVGNEWLLVEWNKELACVYVCLTSPSSSRFFFGRLMTRERIEKSTTAEWGNEIRVDPETG